MAFLKSEARANTVITPTTANCRRWHRQLHLAPIRPVVLPTSARPSTAGGTEDLVAAAQAAMDEAVDRFASYANSSVPAFGRECAVWWVRSIQLGWRPSVHGRFDAAATASAPAPSAATAGANTEIMGTHTGPVGSPIEWGVTLTPSGAGGAANLDTIGSVRARRQSMRTRGDGSAPLRRCSRYWDCVHTRWCRAYSSSEEREYEHGHVRKVLLSSASCPFLER